MAIVISQTFNAACDLILSLKGKYLLNFYFYRYFWLLLFLFEY